MSDRERAVTREDVARLAGVSTAVVSYTLNGGPKAVSPATAAKVHDAVAKLGYRPNQAARSLSRGTSNVIGLVLPDVASPFFAALAGAVERHARAQGLDVLISNAHDEPEAIASLLQHLDAQRVRGILLACAVSDENLPLFYRLRTRVVQLNIQQPPRGIVSILADLRSGSELAVGHLLARGHESVAFLGSASPEEERHRGWLVAHASVGRAPGARAYASFTREGGYEGMRELLAASERPTAVFASSDLIGVGALRALYEAGIAVPREVAVAAFDDTAEGAFATPALTTIHQPSDEMAADALSAVLDEGFLAPGTHVYPVSLVVRGSSG